MSSSENYPSTQDLDYFRLINEAGQPIADSNARYQMMQEIPEIKGEPEFMAIAKKGLREEQQESFDTLKELADLNLNGTSNYERIATEYEGGVLALDGLKASLDDARNRMSPEQRRLDDIARMVSELAPRSSEAAKALADQRKQALELQESASIRRDITNAQDRVDVLGAVYEEAGKAWPVPVLLFAEKVVELDQGSEPDMVGARYIDELPVVPTRKLRPAEAKRLEALGTRYRHETEASKLAVFYLTERRDEVVTVDDLAQFMYMPDSIEGCKDIRSNVTTILGTVQGERIREILAGEGLKLQYGWRRRLGDNGQPQGPRHRVYRVVDLDQPDVAERIIDYGEKGFSDDFEGVSPEPELVEPEKLDMGAVAVEPTIEVVSDKSDNTEDGLSSSPEERQAGLGEELVEDLVPNPGVGEVIVLQDTEIAIQPAARPESKRRTTWSQALAHAVGEAINLLEADNLMVNRPIGAHVVSQMSSSTKMGTLEAIRRMDEAGLLPNLPPVTSSRRQRYELTPRDRIIMSVFNSHSAAFMERARVKRALGIVEKALGAYYKNHPELDTK